MSKLPRLVAVISLTAILNACSLPTYVADRLTTNGLLAIKRGMSYEQVEALVGPPLCIYDAADPALGEAERREVRALVEACSTFQRATISVPPTLRRAAELTLSYAEPHGVSPFIEPSIYINLRSGEVTSVYVKVADLGICCMDGLPTSPFYGGGSRGQLERLIGR